MLIPMGGFSAFDSKEGPLYDPDAPQRFAQTMDKHLNNHRIMSLIPFHINDPGFAEAILEAVYHLNIA
jgi:uncharacterized protein (UPF0261 family)